MISFSKTSFFFSPWEEVDEREVLMKHSNAAAGWKWLSFHTEGWIESVAERCKSSEKHFRSSGVKVSAFHILLSVCLEAVRLRRQNVFQYFSCLVQMCINSWSDFNWDFAGKTVWKLQIYFSESGGNMCWVYSCPGGSVSLPGLNLK